MSEMDISDAPSRVPPVNPSLDPLPCSQDDLITYAWKVTRPGFELPHQSDREARAFNKGAWRKSSDGVEEFVISGCLSLVGVISERDGIGLIACCGIHEDPSEIEYADLSPAQARSLARALNRAAKLAEGTHDGSSPQNQGAA